MTSAQGFMRRMRTVMSRARRARRLGMTFRRAAGFTIPPSITVDGRPLRLHLPEESGTRNAFIEVLLDDCYGVEALHNDVRSVADIGAHAGLFSIKARDRWPQATIHAYEPNPALRDALSRHAQGAPFIRHMEAVGLSAGNAALVLDPDSVQVRTVAGAAGGIPQVAFAEVIARLGGAADLVKLDCEGAEWKILEDAASWQRVRGVTMEFHLWAGYTLAGLHERIRGLGFQITSSQPMGADFGLLRAHRAPLR